MQLSMVSTDRYMNMFFSMHCVACIECCASSHAYVICKGRSSVSLQQKMEVVDAYNTVERLLVVEALLIKEMVRCLSLIREQIDEPLLAEITSMSAILHTMHGNSLYCS